MAGELLQKHPSVSQLTSRPELGTLEMPEIALPNSNTNRDSTRMMLKILIPTETGNHAIKDGSLHRIFETTMSKIKPEAAYFVAEHGQCCAMMFFNMNDASDIPGIVEPLFAGTQCKSSAAPRDERRRSKKGIGHRQTGDVS